MSSSPSRSILDRLTSPAAILVLAAAVRLLFMAFLGNRTYWADTLEYEKTAMQFLSGQGPEGGTPRAPLYPLLMAAGFRHGFTTRAGGVSDSPFESLDLAMLRDPDALRENQRRLGEAQVGLSITCPRQHLGPGMTDQVKLHAARTPK